MYTAPTHELVELLQLMRCCPCERAARRSVGAGWRRPEDFDARRSDSAQSNLCHFVSMQCCLQTTRCAAGLPRKQVREAALGRRQSPRPFHGFGAWGRAIVAEWLPGAAAASPPPVRPRLPPPPGRKAD